MYDECLKLGMMPSEFWDCTHYDIISFIRARNAKLKDDIKVQANIQYQVSLNIISGFGGKIISFNQLFPKLAEDSSVQTWQKQKEIVSRFAERFNARKRKQKEAKE